MTPTPFYPNGLPPAILLMGPTATGKTSLAVELVKRLPVDIISVDSGQVYRGMDIGTAKPHKEILEQAPHRLIDIRDPADTYSAADFRQDALREMADITAAGRVPLLVGGTMLYFRALEHGLSELPSADPDVRAQLEAEAKAHGWDFMHARLARIDPAAAKRIHPNDPQRIQRALEVYELSGVPMTELQTAKRGQTSHYRFIRLALMPADREALNRDIESRFRQMLAQGLVEEVKALFERTDLKADTPAMRIVGYRQIREHLSDQYDYDTMIERAVIATRQFAKRQMTWLRGEQDLVIFLVPDNEIINKTLKTIEQSHIF